MLLQVHLVAIPPATWRERPANRPLALLAADALGIERRIRKGVNLVRERHRYSQLCSQIETLASELAIEGKARRGKWAGRVAALYIDLIERLQQAMPATDRLVGKSFFLPGDEVSKEKTLFASLTQAALVQSLGVAEPQASNFAKLSHHKVLFYEKAEQDGAAVVEVVSMAPLSTPK